MDVVKIENTEFVRDMSTKAVLNTDVTGLARYKEGRRRSLKMVQEAQETRARLSQIESEMSQLKTLINELATLRSMK